MANLNDVIKDPLFWDPGATDDDRKWTLSQVDNKFAGYGKAEQDRTLANMTKTYKEEQGRKQQQQVAVQQEVVPQMQMQQQKKTMWEQAVAPLTNAVGMGMEAATTPAVGLQRMMNGEGAGAAMGRDTWNSVGHGGDAATSRQQAGAGVVPQSPWQAGAMGAQFIPGLNAVGAATKLGPALTRVGASAIGAGGLQGLLGSKGLLEGGTNAEAAGEAAWGAVKGGGTQLAGEAVGKLAGGANRVARGRSNVIASGDANRVQKAVGEIAPEFKGAGKGAAELGSYYKGTMGAKNSIDKEFKQGIDRLEQALVREQGHPYIRSNLLMDTYKKLVKANKGEPLMEPALSRIRPQSGGFLPGDVAEIIGMARQNLKINPTAMGHAKQEGMDALIAEVEGAIPAGARGMLTATRGGMAKASALHEMIRPAFKSGQKKGYDFDINKLQEALNDNPELINRLSKSQLEQMFMAATRNASKGPGLADKAASSASASMPYHPTFLAGLFAGARNMARRGKHVGDLPGTVPQGAKAGLGVAATAASSVKSRRDKED